MMTASISEIEGFLRSKGKILIVGASTNPNKAGFYVPKYLRSIGFETILINPNADEIDNLVVKSSISEVELVDVTGAIVYRRLPEAENVAINLINLGIPLVWLPDRITSELAMKKAEEMNVKFIQNDCPLRRGRQMQIPAV